MTTDRQLFEQVLDALRRTKDMAWDADSAEGRELLTAINARLAQPDSEPVGEMVDWPNDVDRVGVEWFGDVPPVGAKLFTTPQIPEWQPIETAPKDGTEVLVMYVHIDTQIVHNGFYMHDEDDPKETGWWSYYQSECSRIKLDEWMTPTHWMPLPAAPQPKE